MTASTMLAFDLGASGGRAVLGRFDGKHLSYEGVSRFENGCRAEDGFLRWDVPGLFCRMKDAFRACGTAPDSFGVDSWGVDYGLLDKDGRLLSNPRAYRAAGDGEMLRAWERVPRRTLFDRTGIAANNFNTIYQLYRRVLEGDGELARAETMLLIPDLLGYLFTGEKATEYTNATTTGFLRAETKCWDLPTVRELGLPEHILTPVDLPGRMRGTLLPSLRAELGIGKVPFAAVGTHDTASAVAAIPGESDFAFCSGGTWFLFGTETVSPLLTDAAYEAGFSNEGTVQGTFRPLKNIMGLWLIQECARRWREEGVFPGWDGLAKLAQAVAPFRSVIDPDWAPFFAPGNMQGKIRAYCRQTGQPEPDTPGQFARCVYESLALKTRFSLCALESILGRRISTLHLVGGAAKNRLLCRMTADAAERPVLTGPEEAACVGNLLMQLKALGELRTPEEARELVRRSFPLRLLQPHPSPAWRDTYGRLLEYRRQMENEKEIVSDGQ